MLSCAFYFYFSFSTSILTVHPLLSPPLQPAIQTIVLPSGALAFHSLPYAATHPPQQEHHQQMDPFLVPKQAASKTQS